MLQSPTTTDVDRKAIAELQKIAKIVYLEYGKEMFKAGSELIGKTKEQILFYDFKKFNMDDDLIGIGQVTTTDVTLVLDELDEYITLINNVAKEQNYKIVALFVTDVINNGGYIIYNDNSKITWEAVFGRDLEQGTYSSHSDSGF